MNTRRFPVYLVPWHASVTSRGDEESRLVEALIDHGALILQRLLTLQIKVRRQELPCHTLPRF